VTKDWQEIMALADFRYVMRFRVPFCDVDMLQHVNHAAYIVWAETARGGYFGDVLEEPEGGRNGVILARLEFDYERPLDYREEVAVGCRIARFGRKSFDFVHEIWSETRGDRAARGLCAMVTYDHEAKASKLVPERWRKVITAYEIVAPVLTTGVSS
jgi:acyl-CoA thioester hydrolase